MRIKITKTYKNYKQGEILEVSRNVAFDLLDRGVAVISKDMVQTDYKRKAKK